MGLILKRPLCGCALAMAAGILTGMPAAPPLLRVAAVTLAVAAVLPQRTGAGKKTASTGRKGMPGKLPAGAWGSARWRGVLLLALWTASFLTGNIRVRQEQRISEQTEPLLEVTDPVELQGHIYKKQIRNKETVYYLDRVILRVADQNIETHPVAVHISDKLSETDKLLQTGTTAVFRGTLRQLRTAANEGGYDEKQYYGFLGIDYHLDVSEVLGVYGNADRIAGFLQNLSNKLKQNYILFLTGEDAGIVSAMVLGDKELLDGETNTSFRQAGVAHILVVSGMHMSCIGMCVYGLLRRRGGCIVPAAGAVVTLYLYGVLTCWGISAQRAFLMFALSMLGRVIGRTYDVLSGLSFAVILLLWQNPMLIGNVGLQFSVSAILGVVLAGGRLRKLAERRREEEKEKRSARGSGRQPRPGRTVQSLPGKLRDAFCVSLGVQLTTLPLVLRSYYEVPLYGVFLNMLVIPLLGVALCLGILCGGLGLLAPGLARAAAYPLELLLGAMRKAVSLSLALPGSGLITGSRSLEQILLYYIALAVLLFWLPERMGKPRLPDRGAGQTATASMPMRKMALTTASMPMQKIALSAAILLLSAIFLRPAVTDKCCAFLDVGQGDGVYIQAENGTHLFVDGGSSSKSGLGAYTILPFLKYNGVGRIDYWLVSHYDTDHVSGLLEILETDYPIGCLVLPRRDSASDHYRAILELAEAKDIGILYLGQGDRLELGEDTVYCLAPAGAAETMADGEKARGAGRMSQAEGDENESCLAIYYYGKDWQGVFAGDMGTAAEEEMLERNPCLGQADGTRLILKADHHGSDHSNGEAWLTALSPAYCVVSCGENNSYGHPGAEALERMEGSAREIRLTMEEGQVSFYCDGGNVRAEGFLQ